MHKDFFADLLTGRTALLRAVLVFNAVSRSREEPPEMPGLSVEQAEALWKHARVRTGFPLSGPAPFWDFTEESRRLALLDAPTLDRLAWVFGTAVHARNISRVIAGDEVLRLKTELGADLYAYALTRGRFAAGSLAGLFAARDRRLPLARRALKHGREALDAVRAAWPEALRERTRCLFPAPEGEQGGRVPEAGAARDAVWLGLKKLLLKEVAPQWTPCFN